MDMDDLCVNCTPQDRHGYPETDQHTRAAHFSGECQVLGCQTDEGETCTEFCSFQSAAESAYEERYASDAPSQRERYLSSWEEHRRLHS